MRVRPGRPTPSGPGSGTTGCTYITRECGTVVTVRRETGNTIRRLFDQCQHPRGQIGVDPVVDPQALATVRDNARLTQVREMPRDMRLGRANGMYQLTDTKFFVCGQQQDTAQTRIVCQRREQILGWYMHATEYTDNGI